MRGGCLFFTPVISLAPLFFTKRPPAPLFGLSAFSVFFTTGSGRFRESLIPPRIFLGVYCQAYVPTCVPAYVDPWRASPPFVARSVSGRRSRLFSGTLRPSRDPLPIGRFCPIGRNFLACFLTSSRLFALACPPPPRPRLGYSFRSVSLFVLLALFAFRLLVASRLTST